MRRSGLLETRRLVVRRVDIDETGFFHGMLLFHLAQVRPGDLLEPRQADRAPGGLGTENRVEHAEVSQAFAARRLGLLRLLRLQ